MGLNILGEDSRVERGGQDGRSSSGYSQEQPCKRSKDGGKARGRKEGNREEHRVRRGGAGRVDGLREGTELLHHHIWP